MCARGFLYALADNMQAGHLEAYTPHAHDDEASACAGVLCPDSNPDNTPAYYKNMLHGVGGGAGDGIDCSGASLAGTNECDCITPNYNIASDSRGCLKCTTEDCAYYIQNFVETILSDYNIAIYECTK